MPVMATMRIRAGTGSTNRFHDRVELGTTAHLDGSALTTVSVVEPARLEQPVITSKSNLSTIGATILLASLTTVCIDVSDSSAEVPVASVRLRTAGNF